MTKRKRVKRIEEEGFEQHHIRYRRFGRASDQGQIRKSQSLAIDSV